jgi:hypothetical protein
MIRINFPPFSSKSAHPSVNLPVGITFAYTVSIRGDASEAQKAPPDESDLERPYLMKDIEMSKTHFSTPAGVVYSPSEE